MTLLGLRHGPAIFQVEFLQDKKGAKRDVYFLGVICWVKNRQKVAKDNPSQ